MTNLEISRKLAISDGYLSELFSEKKTCGKGAARKFARVLDRPWHLVMAMSGPDLREALAEALADEESRAA